jgi:hypothetical protein
MGFIECCWCETTENVSFEIIKDFGDPLVVYFCKKCEKIYHKENSLIGRIVDCFGCLLSDNYKKEIIKVKGNVVLQNCGPNTVDVIKLLRDISFPYNDFIRTRTQLSLCEAVEKTKPNSVIYSNLKCFDCEIIKHQYEKLDADIKIQYIEYDKSDKNNRCFWFYRSLNEPRKLFSEMLGM